MQCAVTERDVNFVKDINKIKTIGVSYATFPLGCEIFSCSVLLISSSSPRIFYYLLPHRFIIDVITLIFIITSLEWSRDCSRTTVVQSFYLKCRLSFLVNLTNITFHKYSCPSKRDWDERRESSEQDVETVARWKVFKTIYIPVCFSHSLVSFSKAFTLRKRNAREKTGLPNRTGLERKPPKKDGT